MNRRVLLTGLAAALACPAIARAGALMPVRVPRLVAMKPELIARMGECVADVIADMPVLFASDAACAAWVEAELNKSLLKMLTGSDEPPFGSVTVYAT